MNEGVETAFRLMKPRIRSTHVHDNDGKTDQHLFPLESKAGTVDWKRTMELFRETAGQFPLVLELKEQPEVTHPIGNIVRVFERLEAA